jgi:hypothetical protein
MVENPSDFKSQKYYTNPLKKNRRTLYEPNFNIDNYVFIFRMRKK